MSSSERGLEIAGAWTYRPDHPRPHVHPLRAPNGEVLTCDAPPDHPWHHGLWFTIKFVNGANFWEEVPPFGELRHTTAELRASTGGGDVTSDRDGAAGGQRIEAAIEWVDPDGEILIREQRSLTHLPLGSAAYAIDLATTLEATDDLTLDRTPFNGLWGGYSGLTFRGRPDMASSALRLSDGTEADHLEGVPAAWCHLSGEVDGSPLGVAMLDHPSNPRHPVPWYGTAGGGIYLAPGQGNANYFNAALLWNDPLTLAAGRRLALAYRVVVHNGHWTPAQLDGEHRAFASTPHPGTAA